MLPNTSLTIISTKIRLDTEGRFCLNDCHRAAGELKKDGPAYWLATDQARALVHELTDTGNPVSPVSAIKGGRNQGTYAVRELVYAYAMWISPAFHLIVIRAFDALVQGKATSSLPRKRRPAFDRILSSSVFKKTFQFRFHLLKLIIHFFQERTNSLFNHFFKGSYRLFFLKIHVCLGPSNT